MTRTREVAQQAVSWLRVDVAALLHDEDLAVLSARSFGWWFRLAMLAATLGGSLPPEPARMPLVRGFGAGDFGDAWKEIAPLWPLAADGRRHTRWLDDRMGEAAEFRDQKAAAGRASGLSRRQRAANAAEQRSSDAEHRSQSVEPYRQTDIQTDKQPPTRARAGARGANEDQTGEEPEDHDHAVQVHKALMDTSLRSEMSTWNRRRELWRLAERLAGDGLTSEMTCQLWDLAEAKAKDDPGGLMQHWLGGGVGACRAVLDEQTMKRKELALRARPAPPDDDLLGGIYGAEAKA